ncbi:MAG: hypothetical protein JOZ69_12450, partial [Myxococcales bacterium]|nr:hypothetical protein [Myxococcales bacterium]
MYATPGIQVAAVKKNTPILGTQAHAADIAVTSKTEMNYNIAGSMYYIDYTKSGARQFIDSWASLLASYGSDYLDRRGRQLRHSRCPGVVDGAQEDRAVHPSRALQHAGLRRRQHLGLA